MNKDDVNKILEYTANQNLELAKSIKSENLNHVLLKNILENFRSVLDYIAVDIAKLISNNPRVCFPYGRKLNHFKRSIKSNLPNLLEKEPVLYELIKSIQPFVLKENWLVDLCELTNKVKHNQLNRTEKEKKVRLNDGIIQIESKNINYFGNTINGVKTGTLKVEDGEIVEQRNTRNIEIVSINTMKFSGKEFELLPFFEKLQINFESFAEKIYIEIEKK